MVDFFLTLRQKFLALMIVRTSTEAKVLRCRHRQAALGGGGESEEGGDKSQGVVTSMEGDKSGGNINAGMTSQGGDISPGGWVTS